MQITREYIEEEIKKYEASKANHLAQAAAMDGALHVFKKMLERLNEEDQSEEENGATEK